MTRPVLVTPATVLPVTVDEVKAALRIAVVGEDGAVEPHDDDGLIETLIQAAVDHYSGWNGTLGISLVEAEWEQKFNAFTQILPLLVGPMLSIVSVAYRNRSGLSTTIDDGVYSLKTDAAGRSFVRFANAFLLPSDLYEDEAVLVRYKAGWLVDAGKATTPADLRTAIMMRVQLHYDEAATGGSTTLERVEANLLSKYRRFSV